MSNLPSSFFFVTYALISFLFLLGYHLDIAWNITWIIFGLTVVWTVVVFAIRLIKFETKNLDAFLVTFFLFTITIVQPFFYALQDLDFPYAWETEIQSNYIANGTGAILSIFLATYFAGRLTLRKKYYDSNNNEFGKKYKGSKEISSGILFLFSVLAFYPFFFYGTSGIVENFLINITGRETGYVAFSESAIGNSDPVSVLLAQLIPIMVILNSLYFLRNKGAKKKTLHLVLSLSLFLLMVSLGGRTWVIASILTLLTLLYFDSKSISGRTFTLLQIAILITLAIGMLQWQIIKRHQESASASTFAFVGFDINREVALVFNSLPQNRNYIIATNFLEQLLLPLPTYAFFVLTNPVPRNIWNDKPIDPSFSYINTLRNGNSGLETGSNVTVSIPGRAYANFGWPGVVQYGFFLGFILSRLARKIRSTPLGDPWRVVIIFTICYIAVNVREFQAGKLYPIIWPIFIIWIQGILSRYRRRGNPPTKRLHL
jgi:oligosaccharide repeat unit polymerase